MTVINARQTHVKRTSNARVRLIKINTDFHGVLRKLRRRSERERCLKWLAL